MATNARLRFYLYCDLSSLEVDYSTPLADYPEYPREVGVDIFKDTHKSVLGSNYWRYYRGTSSYLRFTWEQVSDDCAATWGMIIASSAGYSPHLVIWEGQGLDGIGLGSLQTITDSRLLGTYFMEDESWSPSEVGFGQWSFKTSFRKEA